MVTTSRSLWLLRKHAKGAFKIWEILTSWIAEGPQLLAAAEEVVDCLAGVTSFVSWLNGFDEKRLSIPMKIVTKVLKVNINHV